MKALPRSLALGLAAAVLAATAACGSDSDSGGDGGGSQATAAGGGTQLIGADRCAQNKAAGKIHYLTSLDLGGGINVLNTVAADALHYFSDLCLDVDIRPKEQNNAQLVDAGTVQIAGVGSASDALTAASNGANIVGIATFGNVGQVELLTMDDGKINSLKDLEGKTLGYKGTMPAQLTAMLINAGVDTSKIKEVSVGFDPSILPQGQVDANQAYKDNEPGVLRRAGNKVKEWNPADYGVKGTFGVQIANRDWAKAHPTAVEDFLRATFKAYYWINESEANLDQAISWSQDRSQATFKPVNEKARWQAGTKIVEANLLPGRGVGFPSADRWQPEKDALVKFKLISKPVEVADVVDDSYAAAVYDGDTLIWPAPGGTGA